MLKKRETCGRAVVAWLITQDEVCFIDTHRGGNKCCFYPIFILTWSQKVGQSAEKTPHAPVGFLLIQKFIKWTQKLKNRSSVAGLTIRDQFLKEKLHNVETYRFEVFLSSDCVDAFHLQEALHRHSNVFLDLIVGL